MAAAEIDIKYVAHLARIALTPGEEKKLAAQLGNMIAVHVLETVGPQEYDLKPGPLADRFAAAYGDAAAAEVAVHLPG